MNPTVTAGEALGPDVLDRLREAGVEIAPDAEALALAGGVSSDIWRVTAARGVVCVKRALPKLRTTAEWTAPVARSASEAQWLHDAAQVRPDLVPEVLAFAPDPGVLVLEYLDPAEWAQWKSRLLCDEVVVEVAARLGAALGDVHASMRGDCHRYGNGELFAALRLEPYIRYTAAQHPAVATELIDLDASFGAAACTVIHGDVSPKNVLVSSQRLVLLDAECATWGDPAFDVGFFLTHLCAKAEHRGDDSAALRACAVAFVDAYRRSGDECVEALGERAARWLPAILLARVDGRSPLEYLSDAARVAIRDRAIDMLREPAGDAAAAIDAWFAALT